MTCTWQTQIPMESWFPGPSLSGPKLPRHYHLFCQHNNKKNYQKEGTNLHVGKPLEHTPYPHKYNIP